MEILKVLYRGAKIIILDEPTAVLVPQEVDALFGNLRELKEQGHTILFISHKLDEVLAIADDITVMRRGTTVEEARPGHHQASARRAHGRLRLPSPETEESTVTDQVQLEVRDLTLDSFGRALLTDIDLTIRRGEVLGIAGVEGNGQAELVESIMARASPPGVAGPGHLQVGHPRASRAGIGYIPEDRHRHELLLDAPLWENRILGFQDRPPAAKGMLIDRAAARKDAERIVDEYDVRTPGIDTPPVPSPAATSRR